MREVNAKPGLVGFERPARPSKPSPGDDVRYPSNFRVGFDNGRVVLVFDASTPRAVAFVLNTVAAADLAEMLRSAASAPLIPALDAMPPEPSENIQ